MTEAEALQCYDTFLWKQVHAFHRSASGTALLLDDLIQEARIAFLQHIRTHVESMWPACSLSIKGALYEYARREYPLTASRYGFTKTIKARIKFCPYERIMLNEWYEDDHTALDLREAIVHLNASDKQIIMMKLEGMTIKEIADAISLSQQVVSYHLKSIKRNLIEISIKRC